MKRTPLRLKRPTPRRKDVGRVAHIRTKPKAGAAPDVAERVHMDRVRALGCLVCAAPATIHHVTSDGFKRIARSHKRIVPLCAPHHQKVFDPLASDPISVEGLGHAGFTAKYGIDLLAEADRLWKEAQCGN